MTNTKEADMKFKACDTVKIVKKAGRRWVAEMDATLGVAGEIIGIASDGNAYVSIGERKFWYEPESLELVPTTDDTEQNPHAALIEEYCKDWIIFAMPWAGWQFKTQGFDFWQTCTNHPDFKPSTQYRRKPQTININGFDVPMPLRVKPELGKSIMLLTSLPNKLL